MQAESQALRGRVALVTGASGGIGASVVDAFLSAGARVVGVDRDPSVAEARSGYLGVVADLTTAGEVEAAVGRAVDHFGALHVLFCGIGASGRGRGDGLVHECSEEAWDFVLDVNLKSVYLTCRSAVPHLLRSQSSSVITLSSVLGLVGDRDFATHAYAAAKGGIIALTRAMAVAYASLGLRCNVLCPGLIRTPMSERAQGDPAILDRLAELQPLTGDFGEPEDVAAVATFLAGTGARFITGAVIPVDGGWTAR